MKKKKLKEEEEKGRGALLGTVVGVGDARHNQISARNDLFRFAESAMLGDGEIYSDKVSDMQLRKRKYIYASFINITI